MTTKAVEQTEIAPEFKEDETIAVEWRDSRADQPEEWKAVIDGWVLEVEAPSNPNYLDSTWTWSVEPPVPEGPHAHRRKESARGTAANKRRARELAVAVLTVLRAQIGRK